MYSIEQLAKAYYDSSEPDRQSVPYKAADLAFDLLKNTSDFPFSQRFLIECFFEATWDNTCAGKKKWSFTYEDEEEERRKEEEERRKREHELEMARIQLEIEKEKNKKNR